MEDKPLQILLADDDMNDRYFFKEALDELSLNIILHTVNDGVQLMDYLAKDTPPGFRIFFFLTLICRAKTGWNV